MKRFDVSALFRLGVLLSDHIGLVHSSSLGAKEYVTDPTYDLTPTETDACFNTAVALGLPASKAAMMRFVNAVKSEKDRGGKLTTDATIRLVADIRSRLGDELASIVFLSIETGHVGFWNEPLNGWEDVLNVLPDCSYDIEEAAKCVALNRSTASAFHSLRVVEIGLKHLWKTTGLQPNAATWGAYLSALDKHAQTSPYPANSLEIQNISNHLRTIKNAWRNQTMHSDSKYTEEEALDIYNALKPLMKGIVKL